MSLPYVPLVAYNGSTDTGGDSISTNLNVFYESGDIAWILTSTALVLLQIPGVGLFYSGLARRKSALSLLWLSVMSAAVVSFEWFFWGYSLTFSHKAGKFIGALDNFGFRNVLAQPSVGSAKVPDLLYAVYQSMFASLTVAIAVGAAAERARLLPCVVFMFIWSTIVYNPIACWTWNPAGWAFKMGALDFAGGTPVHISSGTAALAMSFVLGRRKEVNYRPHSVTNIVLGTVFLWVGWFGFNAGSALTASLRAVMAAFVTNISACVGGITWMVLDYLREKRWSTVGFCSGVVAGLVCITPGSGYVPPWAGIIYGLIGGSACNQATKIKYTLKCDDALDIFAVHAIGGITGDLLTGLFAADYIAALDGYSVIPGGWINGHYVQLAHQLAAGVAGFGYSLVVTFAILYCMNIIPGLKLRVPDSEEQEGIDNVEIGEYAYDFVEVTRDVAVLGSRSEDELLPTASLGVSGGLYNVTSGGGQAHYRMEDITKPAEQSYAPGARYVYDPSTPMIGPKMLDAGLDRSR